MSTTTTTTTRTVARRSIGAVTATIAFVTVAACGTEVAAPRNDIGDAGPTTPAPTFTIEDCMKPGTEPPVTTCPYPIQSGDDFSETYRRMRYDDEHERPGRR